MIYSCLTVERELENTIINMEADADDIRKQALKSSLHRTVIEICNEMCLKRSDVQVNRGLLPLLTDLLFEKFVLYGQEIEIFARHAGRNTVKKSDVYLLVRQSEKLTQFLRDADDKYAAENPNKSKKEKKRKN